MSRRDTVLTEISIHPLLLNFSHMANLDPAVADVLDRADHDSTSDEDGLIDALERDDDMAGLRERRLQQLHAEVVRAKEMRNSHHGTYHELKDEKAIMEITTQTKLVVVHFFRSDFNRCRIMDAHLEVNTNHSFA